MKNRQFSSLEIVILVCLRMPMSFDHGHDALAIMIVHDIVIKI